MRLHKKTRGTGTSFSCDICHSKFLQVTKLLKHIDNAQHIGLNCGICQSKTKTEAEMLNHLESCHRTPGRPFNCQFCETKFRSNRELGLHILKHSDNHPFICTICQKGFKWKQVLKMHMLTHSNDQALKCPTCGFTTKHKSTLKTHLNRHMGRSFSCTQCKFTTAREQNLREHMKNHNREGFTCPICQEKFSQKKNLTRHLVRHSTKLPKLSCNECNFTTLRKDKLIAHMRMKHPNMKEEDSTKQTSHGDPKLNKDSSEAEIEVRTMEKLRDHPEPNRKGSVQEKADKDSLLECKEISIANDVQPLDMRNSASDHLKVAITTVTAEAEENPDAAAAEKEEPVFLGLLGLLSDCPPPRQFTLFSTEIQNPTLKKKEIATPPNGDFFNPPNKTVAHKSHVIPPNGDFVNPPNVTVTHNSPFSYARSPCLTLLSPSDIEAVLCEADTNDQQ